MLDVIVTAVQRETPAILTFELARPDGGPLPGFTAGAHLEVELPDGLLRHYSLCAAPDPAPRHYRIAVLRVPTSRGSSHAMHRLQVGSRLRISEPRNLFPLVPGARRSQLLAAGIGITPILSMAEHLQRQGAHFSLRYHVRDRAHAAFIPWLQASAYAARTRVHFDQGDPRARPNFEHLIGPAAPDDHLYVCGPAGFMDSVLAAARAQGWQPHQLHREHFGSDPTTLAEGRPFEVELARSGRIVPVPADQPVVAALAAQGIVIPVACGQGLCGTCLTPVLAGEIDHRDLFLSEAEHLANDCFTPCCSRAKGERLVLDL